MTGQIKSISQDFETSDFLVMLALAETSARELQDLKGFEKLSVEMKKWHKKRSLDANAYAWVLMSKLSTVLGTSKEEVYETMLQRYGEPYKDGDGYVTITVKTSVDMNKIGGHWLFVRDNGQYKAYMMLKGSSEYDTAEMARFIDGIVSECEEVGIETITQEEIRVMKERWHI